MYTEVRAHGNRFPNCYTVFALRINTTTAFHKIGRVLGIPATSGCNFNQRYLPVCFCSTKIECHQGAWRAYLHVITFQFGMLSTAARSIYKFNDIIECIDQILEWSLVRCFWIISIYFSSSLAVVIYQGVVGPINIFDTFRIHCCR